MRARLHKVNYLKPFRENLDSNITNYLEARMPDYIEVRVEAEPDPELPEEMDWAEKKLIHVDIDGKLPIERQIELARKLQAVIQYLKHEHESKN